MSESAAGPIFISYTEGDAAIARKIARALEAEGLKTWYYKRDVPPGADWTDAVAEAMLAAPVVVLIISSRSLGSRAVSLELVEASEKEKLIVPILCGIDYAELKRRKPSWKLVLGAASAVETGPRGPNKRQLRTVASGIAGHLGREPITRQPVEPPRRLVLKFAVIVAVVALLAFLGHNFLPRGGSPLDTIAAINDLDSLIAQRAHDRVTERAMEIIEHRTFTARDSLFQSGVFYRLGLVRYENDSYRSAIDDLERAVALYPGNSDALAVLGWSYYGVDNREKALECCMEALNLDPENERARELYNLVG
jgi:tetratricopeptide (TPR) repeat protein